MYAIIIDLNTETLAKTYPDSSSNNAYTDIRSKLDSYGFTWKTGGVYFGNEKVNAVTCTIAAMDLARSFPWFVSSVRDIRMLRIEEQNDLRPAINHSPNK